MADAGLKPEKDFSKEADQQIPEAEKLAKVCIYLPYTIQSRTWGIANTVPARQTYRPLSRSLLFSKSKPDRSVPRAPRMWSAIDANRGLVDW